MWHGFSRARCFISCGEIWRTSKELVLTALKNKETGRTPWVPFVGCHAAALIKMSAADYLQSAAAVVDGVSAAIDRYRPDGIPITFDLQIEVETLVRAAREQVRLADMLIINKVDMTDEHMLDEIEAELRSRNNTAPIVRADHADFDLALIPGIDIPRLKNPGGHGHQPQAVCSVSVTESWIIPSEEFRHWCEQQGNTLWRVKGKLMTPAGPTWVEGTLSLLTITACPVPCMVPAATSLALTGSGLVKEKVLRELKDLTS